MFDSIHVFLPYFMKKERLRIYFINLLNHINFILFIFLQYRWDTYLALEECVFSWNKLDS